MGVGIAAVVSLVFGAASPALAEVPDPPPPEPVSGCDWYGELTESVDMEYRDGPEQKSQDRTIEKTFSSQDTGSGNCTAFYSETYLDDFLDLGTMICDPTVIGGDEYEGPTSYRVTLEGEGSGTGGLTAVLADLGGPVEIRISGSGAPYQITSSTVGVSACGDVSAGTTTLGSAAVLSEVGYTDACSAETAVPNLSVQVVVGSCTATTTTDHGPGSATTETRTWTWRFARSVCDELIDTDGGGVGDCAEFDRRTNPFDAADDTPFTDSDGDGVRDESDQCPGTPIGDTVDATGCTVERDSDGDGVLDESDQCAGTPGGVPVDVFGCPADSDGDGVHDGVDECAGTPSGAPVDAAGCALDEDGDGVHDGADQCSGTPAGFPVDANGCALDSDGDGVYDGADVCANTPPGTPVNANGCGEEEAHCTSPAEARGFTLAHYDADMNVLVAPDPDFFDWEVSASWCVVNNEIYFGSASSHGAVTLNTAIATALDLVGITFRYDLTDEESFVTPNQGATTGSVVAEADFDICVRPFDLLLASGGIRKLEKAFTDSASSILGKMPKNGDTAFSKGDVASRAGDAIDDSLREAADGITRASDPKSLNKTTGRSLASDLWDRVARMAESELQDPHLIFDTLQARQNLTEIADQKWQRFLNAYSNGDTVTIPPGQMKAARDLWDQLNGELATDLVQSMYNALAEVTWCGTVWHPELTLHVPHPGESFVEDERVDGSLFDVKGGITVDARSGE